MVDEKQAVAILLPVSPIGVGFFQAKNPASAIKDLKLDADINRERARLTPMFTSRQYPNSAYYQLTRNTAAELRGGASDGAEMGAYCFLKQPQREANIRTVLNEYLRAGLDAGVFYAS